jgi:antitoxin VapB
MRTISIFKNNTNQAIRIPRDMEFKGVSELEIRKEGDTLILRPIRPSWKSFVKTPNIDSGFLVNRSEIFEENRVIFKDDHE